MRDAVCPVGDIRGGGGGRKNNSYYPKLMDHCGNKATELLQSWWNQNFHACFMPVCINSRIL
jgi:hypothetical protein